MITNCFQIKQLIKKQGRSYTIEEINIMISALFNGIQLDQKLERKDFTLIFHKILESALFNNTLNCYDRYLLYQLMQAKTFIDSNLAYLLGDKKFSALLKYLVDEFKSLTQPVKKIYRNDRNPNLVLIVTNQFLGYKHSPTFLVLILAEELKKLGKDVVIINTAESVTSDYSKIDNPLQMTYVEDYSKLSYLEHNSNIFGFYQCKKPTPDIKEINKLISFVEANKPYFVFDLGPNILSEILVDMLPVVSINTETHTIPYTFANISLLRKRKLNKSDLQFLKLFGKNEKNIIDDIEVPAKILEQTTIVTKEQLGLPRDKFIIVIAGNRLAIDINNEIMVFLTQIMRNEKIFILLIGGKNQVYFDKLFKYVFIDNYESKIKYMEGVSELSAIYDNCNLFLNPKRSGNGMNALIAMNKKLPIITFPDCDVASLLSEDFFVHSYVEAGLAIEKYLNNEIYRNEMAQKAYDLGQEYMNNNNLEKIIALVEKNDYFF